MVVDTDKTSLFPETLTQVLLLPKLPSLITSSNGMRRNLSSDPCTVSPAHLRLLVTSCISLKSSGKDPTKLDVPSRLAEPTTPSTQACTSGTASATTTQQEMLSVNSPPTFSLKWYHAHLHIKEFLAFKLWSLTNLSCMNFYWEGGIVA